MLKRSTAFPVDREEDEVQDRPKVLRTTVKKTVSIFMEPIREESDAQDEIGPDPDEVSSERPEREAPKKFTGQTNHQLRKSLSDRRSSVYVVSSRKGSSGGSRIARYTDNANRPVLDEWEERRASIYVVSTLPKLLPRNSISSGGRLLMRLFIYSRAVSRKVIWRIIGFILFILFNVYLSFVIARDWRDAPTAMSATFLTYSCLSIYLVVIYQLLIRKRIVRPISYKIKRYINSVKDTDPYRLAIRLTWCLVYATIATFLIVDTKGERLRLVSVAGLIVIIIFGYVFSKDRRKVKWRPVLWGILLQYIFGLCFIRWRGGRIVLELAEKMVSGLLEHTDYGSQAVYGYLVTGQLAPGLANKQQPIFMYQTLTVMIFVSMWMSVLYHYGIMQKIIMKLGWVLEVTTGTTACESMAVAANMALAIPNSFLTIKPYLSVMTSSELHTVMASGLATIPGNLLGVYTHYGIHAADLMSAMVMSALASLSFTKLFYPETENSRTNIWNLLVYKGEHKSALEAAVSGAISGIEILLRISFNMIAFGSFISFLNSVPRFFGKLVGIESLTLRWLLSKLFLPVAYIMGVEPAQCEAVAWLVGVNLVFSNTSAFKVLAAYQTSSPDFSIRTNLIATYAICGFYTVSSIGIVLGTLGSLVPHRKSEISAIVIRGIISGASICFMTACVAGSLGSNLESDVSTDRSLNKLTSTSFKMHGYWGDFDDFND